MLHYSSVVNMEMCKIINFENSSKINYNSYNDNFFAVVIRRKRKFILAKNVFGVSGTLSFESLISNSYLHCLSVRNLVHLCSFNNVFSQTSYSFLSPQTLANSWTKPEQVLDFCLLQLRGSECKVQVPWPVYAFNRIYLFESSNIPEKIRQGDDNQFTSLKWRQFNTISKGVNYRDLPA